MVGEAIIKTMNLKSIHQLALTLPGGNVVTGPDVLKTKGFVDLGSFITPLLNIVFYLAAFFAFYWLIWGAFQYLTAKGEKEGLAKARAKITWALIGLMVVFMAFFIARFASEIFPPIRGGLPF